MKSNELKPLVKTVALGRSGHWPLPLKIVLGCTLFMAVGILALESRKPTRVPAHRATPAGSVQRGPFATPDSDSEAVYRLAKAEINAIIPNPRDASWPIFDREVRQTGNDLFVAFGTVTIKNDYGATLTKQWHCTFQKHGTGGLVHWECLRAHVTD